MTFRDFPVLNIALALLELRIIFPVHGQRDITASFKPLFPILQKSLLTLTSGSLMSLKFNNSSFNIINLLTSIKLILAADSVSVSEATISRRLRVRL